MEISPRGDVLQVSGPVTGNNAGELVRAIDQNDAKTLLLDGYSSDARQSITDLLRRVDTWLARVDRRLGVSVANSPDLGAIELSQGIGPHSHILVADT
jgi:hypothetical protein